MYGDGFPGEGMGEGQSDGTELLMGKSHGGLCRSVLGVAQNGTACVGAVDPKLMGAAGDRFQFQMAV